MLERRFVVLTGHTSDQPLPDLVAILRRQRKTGRLVVDYKVAPGSFYFKEGELVDAQIGTLDGMQAICVMLAQPEASFNFNPLIPPRRHSIDTSSQKVVLELIGCWEEKVITGTSVSGENQPPTLPACPPTPLAERGFQDKSDPLTLPPYSPSGDRVLNPGVEYKQAALPPFIPDAPIHQVAEVTEVSNTESGTTSRRALTRLKEILFLPSTADRATTDRREKILIASTVGVLLVLCIAALVALTIRFNGREESVSPTPAAVAAESPPSSTTRRNSKRSSTKGTSRSKNSRKGGRSVGPNAVERRTSPDQSVTVETNAFDAAGKNESPSPQPPEISGARVAAKASEDAEDVKKPKGARSGEKTVTIVVEFENGRVSGAAVANRRPGMAAYEASALRIARQRRYPAGTKGSETVQVKISGQN